MKLLFSIKNNNRGINGGVYLWVFILNGPFKNSLIPFGFIDISDSFCLAGFATIKLLFEENIDPGIEFLTLKY